jgi:membrane protease YdiL (CAAX protease family)
MNIIQGGINMKYRCKNCYKVLGPQEEYCTFCGEHSAEVEESMKTGNYDMSSTYKVKLALWLYAFLCIILNGVAMIIFAVVKNTTATGAFGEINSLFASGMVSVMVLPIVFHKDLPKMFFNGSKKQYLQFGLLGLLTIVLILLLSYLFSWSSFLPKYAMDFLQSGDAIKGVDGVYLVSVILSFCTIGIVEEMVFRHYLIDALDEGTLFSDLTILFVSTAIAVFGDFMWTMSFETLLTNIILNLSMSTIYMYTNRSLGVNIILRILLVLITVCIFII